MSETDTGNWFRLRSKTGPGEIHSHSAAKVMSAMLVFGGQRDGVFINELWRYHFGNFISCITFMMLLEPYHTSVSLFLVTTCFLFNFGTWMISYIISSCIFNVKDRTIQTDAYCAFVQGSYKYFLHNLIHWLIFILIEETQRLLSHNNNKFN